jgi:uncharacterized membrane protein YphA (DoxX/SURF4 family)
MKNTFILVMRLVLGAVLIGSGALKVGHFQAFASALAGYQLLDPIVVAPLAVMLPLFQILLGMYLFVGLFTRTIAIATAMLLSLYGGALISAIVRHIPAVCGCFAPNDRVIADWPHVTLDFALVAVAVAIAGFAPGNFALDGRLRRS